MSRARALATVSLLALIAAALGWAERMIPFDTGLPGVKIGLANLVIVLVLYIYGARRAFAVNMLRIAVAGLLFLGPSAFFFSLCGGVVSFLAMWALRRTGLFSLAGVSMAGGVFHNAGQLVVAGVYLGSWSVVYYLPVLIMTGAASGALLGVIAHIVLPRLRKALGSAGALH